MTGRNLSSQPVRAAVQLCVGKPLVSTFWFRRAIIVQTIVADGLRGEVSAKAALESIPCDHAKSFQEGLELFSIAALALPGNMLVYKV